MSEDETSYYRQRAVDERAKALASENLNVREIHEELARQYDALVKQHELRSKLHITMPDRFPNRMSVGLHPRQGE